MKEKNQLSHEINHAGSDCAKDVQAKTLLKYRTIIAHILKGCVKEFENIDVNDIKEKYIQKEDFDESRELRGSEGSCKPEKINGQSNESAIAGEGTVFFDLVFYAYLPNETTLTKFIINLEPQNRFNPGYPLVKRGFYYDARLISSQYGTEFKGSDYGDIKKVISIWICINPANDYKDSMNRYRITEENVVGNVRLKNSDYDVMEVIMICLHRNYDSDNNHNRLINMLSVLFAPDLENDKKQEILENEYDIELTAEYRKAMSDVGANLFEFYIDVAEEKGFNRGLEQGRELGMGQGIEKGIEKGKIQEKEQIVRNMIAKGASDEMILDFTQISEAELEKIKNRQ